MNHPCGQVILNPVLHPHVQSLTVVLHFHVLLSRTVGNREAVQARVCVCRWAGGALMVRR